MTDAQTAPLAPSPASSPASSHRSSERLIEPDVGHRWRCSGCGNLTRFDVVAIRRTAEFWHLDLAGNPTVEESATVDAEIESVTCRWCGRSDAVETVERPDAAGVASESR
jgi:hypothetical protein